jgi:hypothetical protein
MRNSSPRDQKEIGTGNYYYIPSTFLLPSLNYIQTHYSDCYYLSSLFFFFFFFFSAYNFILSSLSLSLSLAPRYIQRSVGSELFYAIVKCYILILYTYIFLSLSLSLSPPRPNKWPAVFSHNLLATKSSTIFFLYFQKRKEDEEEE